MAAVAHPITICPNRTFSASPFVGGGGLHNGQPGSSNPMSIYGTLPKSLGGGVSNSMAATAAYGAGGIGGGSGAAGSGSQAGSTFDMNGMVAGGGGSGRASASQHNTSNGGYNTLGSYRVQYSSTNPFLPSFNPASNGPTDTNGDE